MKTYKTITVTKDQNLETVINENVVTDKVTDHSPLSLHSVVPCVNGDFIVILEHINKVKI